MVKLLQRLKIWRELKRLESKAREAPSPTTYVDLGQVYINLGMHDQTLRVSEEGLALFPNSKELRKLNNFAKKAHLKERIKDLRARLNKTPQPELYKDLAALYLELGDYGAVHGTCEEGIRRFPDDYGAYLVLARAKLATFYRDLRARDGAEAVRCLGKVVGLDRENVRAHKLLGEVLYRIGALNRSLHHLSFLRKLDAGDFEVEATYRRVVKDLGATEAGEHEDLEELFDLVESRNRLARGAVGAEAPRSEAEQESEIGSIRDALGQIAGIPGVCKATYIKGARALIKGQIRDGRDPFLRLARVVAKAAQRACRRMDLGSFNKGVLDGSFGHICVCSFGDVVAAVQCDPGTAVDRILAELQDLVARSLYVSEAVTP
ncbi:MAG: tetratricopeptide repeat protein [Planctomycetota bacterium]